MLSRGGSPGSVAPPPAAEPLPALAGGLEGTVRGISAFRTPNAQFYRIDTALIIPRVGTEGWSLTVDGDVERPFTLTYDELVRMPLVERDITLTCVSNEVGGPYISTANFVGVPLRDVLLEAVADTAEDDVALLVMRAHPEGQPRTSRQVTDDLRSASG